MSRTVGGRVVPHRVISVEAYAAYARGAVAEADGDLQLALEEYSDASSSDGSGVEPWTRKGAVACRLAASAPEPARAALLAEADAAFDRAESNDATFPALWVERARCALDRGMLDEADALSARGLSAEPDDVDASLVRAAVLEKRGKASEAIRLLMGLALRGRGAAAPALEALLEVALRANDAAGRRFAELRLAALGADADGEDTSVLARVDLLLARDDVGGAELLGRRVGLGRADIAVRAAALGKFGLALAIAGPIVLADPRDADAAIAALASAEVTDRAAMGATLDAIRGRRMRPPSPLAALLLVELLHREAGPDAAAIVGEIAPAADATRVDPLEAAVRARVARAN